ncbi:polyphosphate kinase domain protein [Burkholderia cepacia]|nr:polyphosphate kinase domain protein [Burkholderia cepacia]
MGVVTIRRGSVRVRPRRPVRQPWAINQRRHFKRGTLAVATLHGHAYRSFAYRRNIYGTKRLKRRISRYKYITVISTSSYRESFRASFRIIA